ncbi:MAG: amidohydrolase family protein [Maricaulaceae bacterium]|jgi:predicted TIM-barrel fold metal-dependent hydrolase
MDGQGKSPPWDRNLRKPKLKLPAGACDCHFHFIGPQELYPLRPNHVFAHLEFEDDTIEDWLKLQDALGLSRGIHINSMMYKHGYELMLHSLTRFPDRLRGVICPHPSITDGELEVLTAAGVRGARFARRMGPDIDQSIVRRTHEHGWSAHYLFRGRSEIDEWRAAILSSPGDFVIEHMGLPPADQGVNSPEFRFVLECLDTGRCWLKLSPRFTMEETFPFADTRPFVDLVVERYPSRLLWGTDWPHPQYFKPMPNDADLVDQLGDWLPDEGLRRQVLVDNPAELFGFPPIEGEPR